MTDIYNDNSYLEKNPSLHTEDSEFKFQNIKRFLSSIEVKNNRIKILDIGGGAGINWEISSRIFSRKWNYCYVSFSRFVNANAQNSIKK